jgi:hypothetical protein
MWRELAGGRRRGEFGASTRERRRRCWRSWCRRDTGGAGQGRPKLDPFVGIIDRILEEDKGQPAKQQHTSKRIFERLRDEHRYGDGITIVKDYVHERPRKLPKRSSKFAPVKITILKFRFHAGATANHRCFV